jgi:hypothetical protein
MLGFLADQASARRLRLFAVAGARDLLAYNPDSGHRGFYGDDMEFDSAIQRAEALADGKKIVRDFEKEFLWAELPEAGEAAYVVLGCSDIGLWMGDPAQIVPKAIKSFRVHPVIWIRDIFGNPFRPVTFDPRWRTSDVVGLARAIYDDKAFERMPILADALMDAGCEDEQIIAHCRGDGPHVRGCWVVDLVLGKE